MTKEDLIKNILTTPKQNDKQLPNYITAFHVVLGDVTEAEGRQLNLIIHTINKNLPRPPSKS